MISTRFEWWRRIILTRHQTAAYHYFKAVMLTCNKVWGFLKHFTDLSRKWLQGRRFTSAEVCHVGIKNIFGQFVSRQCGDKGEARRMFKKVTLIFNNFFFIVATLCLSVAFNLFVQKVEDTPAQCKLWALNLDDEETERESIKENKSKSSSEVLRLQINKLNVNVELQNSTRPSYRCLVMWCSIDGMSRPLFMNSCAGR